MIQSIQIEGYRGFSRFEMSGLGRVNLLVGRNNSGKTSVLEALFLLSTGGDPQTVVQLCSRRGESLPEENERRRYPMPEIDISHLFTGHELSVGSSFSISAKNQNPQRFIKFEIAEQPLPDQPELPVEPGAIQPRLAIVITGIPRVGFRPIPLSRKGGVSAEMLDMPPSRFRGRGLFDPVSNSHYISTESLTGNELVRLWERIALSPHEDLVLKALQFLDSKIERIASISTSAFFPGSRGGFITKLEGIANPVPIGSMGDGMWRMLAMAIAITQCKDGVLLVDEIDTGLHYTVMSDMWRLIFSAAKEFNVQVFATSHSFDCAHSLATICHADIETNSQVTIQRIEIGRRGSIPFSEAEIKIAAEMLIEIR